MWMMPLHLHVNQKSDYDDYDYMMKYDKSDPTQVDLTSNFFVLCTNMKVYLYNYS